ncbi:unnamed protein product [Callosobruchus maculatus]|uniref:Uncharacterized protein n=1 Tax=Callosobruchus maculatus TaxID=64391 RepID=A0A653BQI9_CALMS|nr:unnamed protein product [Callosobruchus maculatus]
MTALHAVIVHTLIINIIKTMTLTILQRKKLVQFLNFSRRIHFTNIILKH